MRVAIRIVALLSIVIGQVSLDRDRNLTGVLSTVRPSEKSGDIVGAEISIAPDRTGYSATVRASEGAPGVPEAVAIFVRGGTIEFSIPVNSASGFAPGTYTGVVTSEGLRLRGPKGRYENYFLPRKDS